MKIRNVLMSALLAVPLAGCDGLLESGSVPDVSGAEIPTEEEAVAEAEEEIDESNMDEVLDQLEAEIEGDEASG